MRSPTTAASDPHSFNADSYSLLERRVLGPVRELSGRYFFRPLVLVLARVGVSPNGVSALQIPLGLIFVWTVGPYPRLAFLLMIAAIFLDGLDGALARHSGRTSAFGALWDQFCDHLREVLVVAGLAWVGAASGLWATLYAFVYPTFNLTLALANRHGAPLPWAIKSYLTLYPFIFLYLWWGIDWLDIGLILSIAAMGLVIAQGLYRLRHVLS